MLVLEARPTLGGRATAFTDPATGERVDNGQHVLFGCYHETFRFLRRIGAEGHVRVQHRLAVDMIDRAGRWSRLACPPLPSPLHLLAGVMTWNALGWRDRLSALQMRLARCPTCGAGPDGPRETVRAVARASERPDAAADRAALGAAGGRGAQSADRPGGGRAVCRVLRPMFGRNPRNAALALPSKPLDEMYALPRATFIEAAAADAVRVSSPATIRGRTTCSHVATSG